MSTLKGVTIFSTHGIIQRVFAFFKLFHSVYEKSVFEKNPPNHLNREKLRSVVGEDLEKLI